MRKLLNTLYVTTQGSHLSCEGETVRVEVDGDLKLRIPVHTLDGVVCFGRVYCTPPLLELCAEHNVSLSYLTEYGRFRARLHGPVSGNVLLRREQYRRADDTDQSGLIARAMVGAKIANARTVLLRSAREHSSDESNLALRKAADYLSGILRRFKDDTTLDILRGWEGEAAHAYFSAFERMIVSQRDEFPFKDRNRRPPLDNVNALLSFLYTLLVHDVVSALETVGLDPAVGFLHSDRPGRPSLALDLMEEFRPMLADRVALSLINRQQVKGSGFTRSETGAVMMDDKTRKEVIVTYQKRKAEEIHHPFLEEKFAVGLLPYAQALLLARHLRGALDAYPAFIWK